MPLSATASADLIAASDSRGRPASIWVSPRNTGRNATSSAPNPDAFSMASASISRARAQLRLAAEADARSASTDSLSMGRGAMALAFVNAARPPAQSPL